MLAWDAHGRALGQAQTAAKQARHPVDLTDGLHIPVDVVMQTELLVVAEEVLLRRGQKEPIELPTAEVAVGVEPNAPQILGESLSSLADDAIRRFQDSGNRSVVLIECHHMGAWKFGGEIEHVADGGGTEAIDTLCIITHNHDVVVVASHGLEEDVVNERALTGAGDAGDADQPADRESHVHALEVVLAGALDGERSLFRVEFPPLLRRRVVLRIRSVRSCRIRPAFVCPRCDRVTQQRLQLVEPILSDHLSEFRGEAAPNLIRDFL